MANSADLTAAEEKLALARISCNTARQQLQIALERYNAPAVSHDHLINLADEFGVDHALSDLGKNPASFSINRDIGNADLAVLKPLLSKAYEANHHLDAALGEREALLMSRNPNHIKAFQVGGEEVAYSPERGVLIYPNQQREVPADLTYVKTRDEGPAKKKDRDRC